MIYFIMAIGVIVAGFGVVFMKTGSIDPLPLASYRLLFASFILFPLFLRDTGKVNSPFQFKSYRRSLLPGAILGIHFTTAIIGTRLIPGGHATALFSLSPVVMPFLMYFMVKEKITSLEILGTAVSIGGVIYLGFKDSHFSSSYLKGDGIIIISMVFLTLYLALARKNRSDTPFWYYIVPLYFTGGLVCLIMALLTGSDMSVKGMDDYISLAGLTLVNTIVGHGINNYGMRKLRGQVVSLIKLTQIISGTALAFLFLGEIPPGYFYYAALIILAGPLILILFDKKRKPLPEPPLESST